MRWLLEGAPAGIQRHPESLGIFPQSEAAPSKDFELSFATGYADFNYTSMDESPYSQEVLDDLVNAGYVTRCESIAAAIQHFAGKVPVVSKGALITKEKEGVLKHRLILDCRISGTNSSTYKWERILLPRAWDLVRDGMRLKDLAQQRGEDPSLFYFVCDLTDAFYKVPLAPEERHYFTLCYQGAYYCWNRVGQGSLNGPTLFGRFSTMLGRISQSILDSDHATLQIYVDDPVAVIRGGPRK